MTGRVFGFVFTVTRYSDGRAVAREHPAYRDPGGPVVWAPDRAYWRDAPADVRHTFRTGDAAADHMARLRELAAMVGRPVALAGFRGSAPVSLLGTVENVRPANGVTGAVELWRVMLNGRNAPRLWCEPSAVTVRPGGVS